MQECIVFLVRAQCRRKKSSHSLSHLLMSLLYDFVNCGMSIVELSVGVLGISNVGKNKAFTYTF